jgi:hypothetical protein
MARDVSILFEDIQRAVKRGSFDIRIRKCVISEVSRQVVTISLPALSNHQQKNRLNKPIQVSHGAGAGIIDRVMGTFSAWHSEPPTPL